MPKQTFLSSESRKIAFNRILDLDRNLGNVKEKPSRKTCFSVKRSSWLHVSTLQNFARWDFFDFNIMKNQYFNGREYLKRFNYRSFKKKYKSFTKSLWEKFIMVYKSYMKSL